MKHLIRILVLALLVAGLVAGGAATMTVRIPAGKIGVRQDKWGGGIEARDFDAGYHLGTAGKDKWHILPAATQLIEFSPNGEGGHRIEVRTADNNTALVSATISWRIRPGRGHVVVQQGLERNYRSQVRNAVESVLRTRLAELSSEAWFDTDRRREKLDEIETALEEEFVDGFAQVESVLVHEVTFSSEYEGKLQENQILYQEERKLEADTELVQVQHERDQILHATTATMKAASAAAAQERQLLQAEHDLEVAAIAAAAHRYEVEQRSAADRQYAGLVAEGQLAQDRTTALGDRLRLEVLDTKGGRLYLAQQAAANLGIEQVTLNSNDPEVPSVLDLDELVGLLVGEDG